jgi:hypothetical protein
MPSLSDVPSASGTIASNAGKVQGRRGRRRSRRRRRSSKGSRRGCGFVEKRVSLKRNPLPKRRKSTFI